MNIYITPILLSFVTVLAVIVAMAIGVLNGRKPISGSCGICDSNIASASLITIPGGTLKRRSWRLARYEASGTNRQPP